MEQKNLSLTLIIIGVASIIVGIIISLSSPSGQGTPPAFFMFMPLLMIITGMAMLLFGAFNYTKLKLWLKIVLTLIALPIALFIFVYLSWGFSTGFRFTF